MQLNKKIIILFVLILLLSNIVLANNLIKTYNLAIQNSNNKYSLIESNTSLAWETLSQKMFETSIHLTSDHSPTSFLYTYKIKNNNDDIIKENNFFVPKNIYVDNSLICFENGKDESCTPHLDPDNYIFDVNIPYIPSGTEIILYDENKEKILEIDVSEHANYCGDGFCKGSESFYNCPIDCQEEEFIYNEQFLNENFEFESESNLQVFNSFNNCLQNDKKLNCLELSSNLNNFYINEQSSININMFDDDKIICVDGEPVSFSSSEFFINDLSSIKINNYNNQKFEFELKEDAKVYFNKEKKSAFFSKKEFEISFDKLNEFPEIIKTYETEENLCTEIFNPCAVKNPLKIICE